MTRPKRQPSRVQARRILKMMTRQARWAWSYRLIAFDCRGRHKFAVTVPVRRRNFNRLTEGDECEYEPEEEYQPQLAGLYDIFEQDALSFGKSWTNLNLKEVDDGYVQDKSGDITVEKYRWMRLRADDSHTKAARMGGMLLLCLKRQYKADALMLFRRLWPAPEWTLKGHTFYRWVSTAISMEHYTGFVAIIFWLP